MATPSAGCVTPWVWLANQNPLPSQVGGSTGDGANKSVINAATLAQPSGSGQGEFLRVASGEVNAQRIGIQARLKRRLGK